MKKPEVISIAKNTGTTYVDPKNTQVIIEILEDLKRKVAITEELLDTMLQEHAPENGSQVNSE